MDNQHKMIKGYRDLSAEEIALMNEIKAMAVEVGALVDRVQSYLLPLCGDSDFAKRSLVADPFSWHHRAKDDLQDGFMKLTRAVAQPTTF